MPARRPGRTRRFGKWLKKKGGRFIEIAFPVTNPIEKAIQRFEREGGDMARLEREAARAGRPPSIAQPGRGTTPPRDSPATPSRAPPAPRRRRRTYRGYSHEDVMKALKYLRGEGVRMKKMNTVVAAMEMAQAETQIERARVLERVFGSVWVEKGIPVRRRRPGGTVEKRQPGGGSGGADAVVRFTRVLPRPAVEDVRKIWAAANADPVRMTVRRQLTEHELAERKNFSKVVDILKGGMAELDIGRPEPGRRRRGVRDESDRWRRALQELSEKIEERRRGGIPGRGDIRMTPEELYRGLREVRENLEKAPVMFERTRDLSRQNFKQWLRRESPGLSRREREEILLYRDAYLTMTTGEGPPPRVVAPSPAPIRTEHGGVPTKAAPGPEETVIAVYLNGTPKPVNVIVDGEGELAALPHDSGIVGQVTERTIQELGERASERARLEGILKKAGIEPPPTGLDRAKFFHNLFIEFSLYSKEKGLRWIVEKEHPQYRGRRYTSSEGTPEYSLLNSAIKALYYDAVETLMHRQGEPGWGGTQHEAAKQIVNSWREDMGFGQKPGETKIETETERVRHTNQALAMIERDVADRKTINFDEFNKHLMAIGKRVNKKHPDKFF
jgi:hypothetical protein